MLTFCFDFRDVVPLIDVQDMKRKLTYRDIDNLSYDDVTEEEALSLEPKPLYGYNTPV